MSRVLWLGFVVLALAGCDSVPYRSAGFGGEPDCRGVYNRIDDLNDQGVSAEDRASPCWLRSHEQRDAHDLLFVEFDDQGWVQGSDKSLRPPPGQPRSNDYFDDFGNQLQKLYRQYSHRGLTLVVFVHGWHHNARADDSNVRDFRRLLDEVAHAENRATQGGLGRRVVGIYVGWRGESLPVDYLSDLTFWDRKAVAERVAQGSVRELFARLDHLRDEACLKGNEPAIRLLTIGHSFGGLITYNALSGELLRTAARADANNHATRLGDLVVIVNPAFEGTRYEPLLAAGQRPERYRAKQLPVVIVATSRADLATRIAFPFARVFSTLFETQSWEQWLAGISAVGHSDRYITHDLSVCDRRKPECRAACPGAEVKERTYGKLSMPTMEERLIRERNHMAGLMVNGFGSDTFLCNQLYLTATDRWAPENNPFWVVSTSGDVMKGHNDIFNNYFVGFIRQMYLAVLLQQEGGGNGQACATRQPRGTVKR